MSWLQSKFESAVVNIHESNDTHLKDVIMAFLVRKWPSVADISFGVNLKGQLSWFFTLRSVAVVSRTNVRCDNLILTNVRFFRRTILVVRRDL